MTKHTNCKSNRFITQQLILGLIKWVKEVNKQICQVRQGTKKLCFDEKNHNNYHFQQNHAKISPNLKKCRQKYNIDAPHLIIFYKIVPK